MNTFERMRLLKLKTHKWYYLRKNTITLKCYRKPHKRCQEVLQWLDEERWYSNPFYPNFPFRYYYTRAKRNKTYLPDIRVWRNMK
jgi:hypothetical protein